MVGRFVVLFAVFVAILGCGSDMQPDPDHDFDDYRAFVEKIAGADSVVMHEGLPSGFSEPALLEAELAKNTHVELDGYPFYEGGKPLSAEDAAEITRLFSKEGVAMPYMGVKACGGFHPDFTAEWLVGSDKYRAHVCFNCHEIRAIGPGIGTLTDIISTEFTGLQKALQKYQDKRPSPPR